MAEYEPTPEAVGAFKRAWHEADAEGDEGNRVSRGLAAALAQHDAELRAEVERLREGAGRALVDRDAYRAELDEARQQVADLRAGIIAAVTVLNREFYRRPVTWIERLAKDLRALLAGSDEQADRWEYGVKWGDEPDDSRPTLCESREHAESRAAASHGDKIVRRTPARTIPAGEWEEMPDE